MLRHLICILPFIIFICLGCSSSFHLKKTPQATLQKDEPGVLWRLLDEGTQPGVNVPSAGEDAAVAFDDRENRLVFFGGKTDEDVNTNETWFYFPERNQWEKLTASGVSPPAREDHVLAYDSYRYKIILHGGEDGDTSNELWELDLNTLQWENKTTAETPFLEGHDGIHIDEKKGVYIFGGENEQYASLADLWFLDLDPESPGYFRWKKIEPEGKKHPAPRVDPRLVYDHHKNRLLLYGGWDKGNKVFTNETWEYSFEQNRWEKITPKRKRPFPPSRRHAGSVADIQNNLWIIFGGKSEGGLLNDIWVFDMENDVWINVTPGPSPRMDHIVFYEPRSGEIYLYGGDHIHREGYSQKLHDLWKFKLKGDSSQISQVKK